MSLLYVSAYEKKKGITWRATKTSLLFHFIYKNQGARKSSITAFFLQNQGLWCNYPQSTVDKELVTDN